MSPTHPDPTLDFARLEKFAASLEAIHGWDQGQSWGIAPRDGRWPFRLDDDGLVHQALAGYRSLLWVFDGVPMPALVITECGRTSLPDKTKPGVHACGRILRAHTPITCVCCASGNDVTGVNFREWQKSLPFMHAYGGTAQGYAKQDAEMTMKVAQLPRQKKW